MTSQKRVSLTVGLLLAFTALVAGFFVSQHVHKGKRIDVSKFHGTLLTQPRGINSFSLTGTDEAAFNNQRLQGQWTLVFFGFTNCGYLCPTTMAELAKTYRILEQRNIQPLPRVVMISIDPERDSLKKLNAYVKSFHPNFYGARGDMDAIEKMTQEMGIAFLKPDDKSGQPADIQHSGAVMLFNPNGELNAFFTSPQAALLAKDYQLLVD